MTTPLLIFSIATVYVFCKAFQQRNVVFNNFLSVPLFSYFMAYGEMAVVGLGVLDIAENGWHRILILGFAQGTGGTLGCWAAMAAHRWLHRC